LRIAIYGAGAVGGHLAARIAHAGIETAVVARGAHLRAIQADGLRLRLHDGSEICGRVTASDDPTTLPKQDAIIVSVKQPGLPAIVEGLQALSHGGTIVAFALNGIPWWYERGLDRLDPGGRLAAAVPDAALLGCVVQSPNEVVAPGVIHCTFAQRGIFHLGPAWPAGAEAAHSLSQALQAAGIDAPMPPDLRAMIWSKLMLNVGFSVQSAILDVAIGPIARDPRLLEIAVALASEIRDVATAMGSPPTIGLDVPRRPFYRQSEHRPSILQDLTLGRPMEIDGLLTVPQDFARRKGVPTPHLDTVTALLIQRARAKGCYA